MSVLRCLSIAAALVGLASVARAQAPIAFERATEVEAALPQSSVYRILEDQRGFLWFATREGLGRWDGTTMRTWRRDPFNPASLPGNIIRHLIEDEMGDLWATTDATDGQPTGLARLIGPSHEEVRRYGHPGTRPFVGPDGRAWFADSVAVWRFDANADRFVRAHTRPQTSPARRGLTTRDGTVWISADDGLEAYTPDGHVRTVGVPDGWGEATRGDETLSPVFSEMAEGPDGTLWVGGVRLGRLDANRQRIEIVPHPVLTIHSYGVGLGVGTILPDRDGLWVGTLDGVYRIHPDEGTYERHSLRLPGDIPTQNWVTGLLQDRAGTLWAGTVWGLHRASPAASPFRLLAHDPEDPNTLGSGIVLSIHRDAREALWVGTLGGGLNRVAADGRVTRYRHREGDPMSLSNDWIWSLASDDQHLWVGTADGLDRIDMAASGRVDRQNIDAPPLGDAPGVHGLWRDDTGTLWFGLRSALWRRSPNGSLASTPIPGAVQIVGAGRIEAIRIVRGGAWATSSAGLLFYDASGDSFRVYRHDPNDPTSIRDDATIALHIDRQGRVWVGSQSGLSLYNAETDGFTHITSADGLPSDVVYAILEDDAGRLWISTNRGLARYDESASPRIRTFTVSDGVGNVEFNRNAAWRDADGTMFFGGDRGVTVFHPDDLTASAYSPPVVVTAILRATRVGQTATAYGGAASVSMAPDVTTFGFSFAALDFTHAHHIRYAVRLDGWDEGWVEIGAQRDVSYTNLPPGIYTFRVRAANADGVWGEEAAPVSVVVRPEWWETFGFRLLALLAAIGLVAGVGWDLSRRRYRRQLARLEAQRALDAERARISRDMHDEVGASLSEIAVLSEVARRQLDASSPADDRLRRIADTSRAMLESLGHIVWAINPRNDTLPALVATLREHAARTLEAHQIDGRLRFPREVPARPVSAEVRRAVFLILKEALHNVVKHAEAETVSIELAVAPDGLVLTIQDDGTGFSEPSGDGGGSIGGTGLGNMRRRAYDAGGTLTVIASPGAGCTVRLAVPLTEDRARPTVRLAKTAL